MVLHHILVMNPSRELLGAPIFVCKVKFIIPMFPAIKTIFSGFATKGKNFTATFLILSDSTGRTALQLPLNQPISQPVHVPVGHLKPGTYLLQVGSSRMLVQVVR